ncbi:SDR family NAD(P)-dependent oxidoreductase [Streptomyces sp. NPDC086010]|uniref:SDR family NAD(P)-dependent oxidoreductase n=1 Tax=Streptomyces sp. NPDC086010 TaxID=3365745 RepID=UPI0037D3F43B
MSRTLAVFGAGTGLGAATARRFGEEGYAVALVARRPERLNALVAALGEDGIEAAAFPADLSEPAAVPALVERITDRFGRIDVVEYAPIPATAPMLPATEVTADLLERLAGLYLHTPVETARAVLPAMIERGDGAFLLGQGVSAVRPLPGMSGVGPVMAAARNWILSLHGELAAHGVYAGTLSVAAWIEGSAGHLAASDADPGLAGHPTVTAAELADQYWDLYTRRDRPERVHPPLPAV